jgi:hypothetical protein
MHFYSIGVFDLKSKLIYILSNPSDPITETWKLYKDMDELEFFIQSNNLVEDEFIELPSGRELVAYV